MEHLFNQVKTDLIVFQLINVINIILVLFSLYFLLSFSKKNDISIKEVLISIIIIFFVPFLGPLINIFIYKK